MNRSLDSQYENNVQADISTPAKEMIIQHVELQWKLGQWRQNLPHFCSLVSEPWLDSIASSYESIRFSILLSLQSCYAGLLANRPILTRVLTGLIQEQNCDADFEMFLQYGLTVAKDDYQVIKSFHHIIRGICADPEGFVDRNGIWWLCNYSGNRLPPGPSSWA